MRTVWNVLLTLTVVGAVSALFAGCASERHLKKLAVVGSWASACEPFRPFLPVQPGTLTTGLIPTALAELPGTASATAVLHTRHSLVIEHNHFIQQRSTYSDEKCESPVDTVETTGLMRAGLPAGPEPDMFTLDLLGERRFLTARSSERVKELETAFGANCDGASWALDLRSEVTDCKEMHSGERLRAHTVYALYQGMLFLGLPAPVKNMTSTKRRPVQLDLEHPLFRRGKEPSITDEKIAEAGSVSTHDFNHVISGESPETQP